ncbi:VOC family protein [Altererythrobacter confluentis]|uniref:VOC family protein n=1 Tax=Allopontixanthobacter confluentis TaxID=1849021 RepID=A0A6L7GG20_9SPHN|nr:VOC family protein [Allopontixanthobacter confluentis]MXP14797.1 VOC family protein [Allopontixanthobacter confluentis]
MAEIAKLTNVLWYNGDAEEAAKFYAETFPDSSVGTIFRAPSDYPSGKAGDALTVEFTVLGRAFSGLNGGDMFTPNESVSFMVVTEDQEETDRYWNAIINNGGSPSECGWCKDKWGFSWQITPRTLLESQQAGGEEARRAFAAMMAMQKIDVAMIEAARKGG